MVGFKAEAGFSIFHIISIYKTECYNWAYCTLGIQEKIEIFKNATERKVFGTVGICDEEKNSVLILNRIFQNFEIMFTGGLGNSTGGLGQSVSNQYDFHNVSHLSHLLYPHKILLFLFRSVIILIKLVAG